MARRAMIGPGSKHMGGSGKKPRMAATPFSSGGPGGGMAPPTNVGGPRAMPGAGPAGGGMGGMMKKGGTVKKHAHGGEVTKDEKERPGKREREEDRKEEHSKFRRGGAVIAGHTTHGMPGKEHPVDSGISKGSDSRRSAGPKGSESRTHKPHSGKAS